MPAPFDTGQEIRLAVTEAFVVKYREFRAKVRAYVSGTNGSASLAYLRGMHVYLSDKKTEYSALIATPGVVETMRAFVEMRTMQANPETPAKIITDFDVGAWVNGEIIPRVDEVQTEIEGVRDLYGGWMLYDSVNPKILTMVPNSEVQPVNIALTNLLNAIIPDAT